MKSQTENIMKQFNLEEYLANPSKKVVTRDGRNVRIICTDRVAKEYKLVALVMKNDTECMCAYNTNGCVYKNDTHSLDLFFAPEKHEGWVNIFVDAVGNPSITDLRIFTSKEDAEKEGKNKKWYIKTAKIEWEE